MLNRHPASASNELSVEDLSELQRIQQDGTGGFEQSQVQLALAFLFQYANTVYVPSINELAGSNTSLPLKALKTKGYQQVVFSFQLNDHHQVAVSIKLGDTHQITILDSKENGPLNKEAELRLKSLLGDHQYHCQLQMGISPYQKQQDDWSCGLFVIAHLWNAYSKEVNVTDDKIKLDVGQLLKSYYHAYKEQAHRTQNEQAQADYNDSIKRKLLELIELKRKEDDYYGKENSPDEKDIWRSFANFLQFECWGNLARLPDPCNQANRKNDSTELRTRPLNLTLEDYARTHPNDDQRLSILPQSNADNIMTAIKWDLGFLLSNNEKLAPEKLMLLKNLLNDLCMSSNIAYALKNFLARIDSAEYYQSIDSIDHARIWFQLIKLTITRTMDLDVDLAAESDRVKREQEAQAIERGARIVNIKKVLIENGLPILDDLILQLANNMAAYMFILKFFVDPRYFKGCSATSKWDVITKLLAEKEHNGIVLAFKLYPGKKHLALMNYFNDLIYNPQIAFQVMQFVPDHKQLKYATQRIEAGDELDQALQVLSEHNRLQAASSFREKIENGSRLIAVIDQLPEPCRYDFADAEKDKIQNGRDLATLLLKLPPNCRYTFADSQKSKIRDCYELSLVIETLPDDVRLDFVSPQKDKLQDEYFYHIVSALPENNRYHFIIENKNKIQSSYTISRVLSKLPPDQRHIADKFKHIIQDGYQVDAILSVLPPESCLAFAIAVRDKIKDGLSLAIVLTKFPEKDRCQFALDQMTNIDDGLDYILSAIVNINQRWEFISLQKNKIHSITLLAKILSKLPEDKQLVLAEEFKHKIINGREVAIILNSLIEKNRAIFLEQVKRHVATHAEFILVIKQLPDPDKLGFAKTMRHNIFDIRSLLETLAVLPDDQRFMFAKECTYEVKTIADFKSVIEKLPDPFKLNYALLFKGSLLANQHIKSMLEAIPPIDHINFLMVMMETSPSNLGLFKPIVPTGKPIETFDLTPKKP